MATTLTFGAGGFYPSLKDAWFAFSNTGGLTFNTIFKQVGGNVVDSTGFGGIGYVLNMNGYSLEITSDSYHYGKYNTGYEYEMDVANTEVLLQAYNGTVFTVHGMKFNRSILSGLSRSIIEIGSGFELDDPTQYIVKDCLFRGPAGDSGDPFTTGMKGLFTSGANTDKVKVINNKFWGFRIAFDARSTPGPGLDIPYLDKRYFENNICYNCFYGFYERASAVPADFQVDCHWKNNLALLSVVSGFDGILFSTVENNANDSTDLPVGDGNINNVPLNSVISIDETNDDFLKIANTSPLYNVGSIDIQSENDSDIEGNPRPSSTFAWVMGATPQIGNAPLGVDFSAAHEAILDASIGCNEPI